MAQATLGSSLLGRLTPSASSIKLFEIRLEENPIFLRGVSDVASDVVLKGTLVLCLSEALHNVRSISLRFTGDKKMKFIDLTSHVSWYSKLERIAHETWEWKSHGSGESLEAGNYSEPFELALPGDTPESIEGLDNNWIIYRLKATIVRGLMQKEEITRKNVRIVRTLGPTDLDSTLEMLVRKTGVHVWPGKVRYTISVPGIAFAYGTYVEFKYCLSHLLQGYKVEKIVTLLKEAQLLTLVEKDGSQGRFRNTRTVAEDDYSFPVNLESQRRFDDGALHEEYRLSRNISIPRNLKKCMQSVNHSGFCIKHYLVNALTPPGYGDHWLDQLYSDFDDTGYDTPTAPASGSTTPHGPGSRSTSNDNIASMHRHASSSGEIDALQRRLNELNVDDRNGKSATENSHGPTTRQYRFFLQSRRTSEDGHSVPASMQTPRQPSHSEFSDEGLARVPSYSTALQSRPNVPIDTTLPTYQTAVRTAEPSPPPPAQGLSGPFRVLVRRSNPEGAASSSEETAP